MYVLLDDLVRGGAERVAQALEKSFEHPGQNEGMPVRKKLAFATLGIGVAAEAILLPVSPQTISALSGLFLYTLAYGSIISLQELFKQSSLGICENFLKASRLPSVLVGMGAIAVGRIRYGILVTTAGLTAYFLTDDSRLE